MSLINLLSLEIDCHSPEAQELSFFDYQQDLLATSIRPAAPVNTPIVQYLPRAPPLRRNGRAAKREMHIPQQAAKTLHGKTAGRLVQTQAGSSTSGMV